MREGFILFPILVLVSFLAIAGCSSQSAHEDSATPARTRSTASDAPTCATDADCTESQFCARPIADCDGEDGQCVDKPQMCTRDWRPVCGCDGKVYGNACEAASAGQNIDYEGECREE